MLGSLGRLTPTDWGHVERSPLSALTPAEQPVDIPVTIGTPWYTGFDTPTQLPDGSWHLPDTATGSLGTIRGGHCTVLAPMGYFRYASPGLRALLWRFYDQGQEGACEGFAHSHAQSILRGGATFDAFWLYDEARKLEGTYPGGEGTTNRAVCEVLENTGERAQEGEAVCTREAGDGAPVPAISVFRWATTAEEVCSALGRPNALAVPLLNSWGTEYPEVVWLPVDTLERLLREEGEADVVSER
jgi:hypothetical protein